MNIGEKDQLMQALGDVALMTWQYYSKLVEAGFTPDQALTLTVEQQAALIAGSNQNK